MLKVGNYQLLSRFILDDEAKPAWGQVTAGALHNLQPLLQLWLSLASEPANKGD